MDLSTQIGNRQHDNRRPRDIWGCLALVALVLALFLPTVSFGFVNWDDPWYVVNNPLIRSWRPGNLWAIATQPAVRNYAPLTLFGYLIQHSLWGDWAGGYHLVNVLLHALNSVLVYVLIKQLAGNRFIAWTTAALFALHPVQVETVAWISSFKGLLSGTFILGSLICWLRPRPAPRQEVCGILFHALGLLSKALGITVPAIVFSYDMVVGRKRLADALARQLIPTVLAVLILLVTMSAQTAELGGVRGHLEWSKSRVAAMDTVILWKYVGLLVWPHDLCVLYDPPTSGIAATIALAALGWSIVALAAFALRDRWPLALVGLVAFLALLFPVLNFFPITTLINDRYLYLPSIPVFALMATVIERITQLGSIRVGGGWQSAGGPSERVVANVVYRSLAWAVCGVLLLGFAVATHERLPVWRDDRALWADAFEKSPGLAVVRLQWATSLHNSQNNAAAVAVLEQALVETHPDQADRQRIEAAIADWKHSPAIVE